MSGAAAMGALKIAVSASDARRDRMRADEATFQGWLPLCRKRSPANSGEGGAEEGRGDCPDHAVCEEIPIRGDSAQIILG